MVPFLEFFWNNCCVGVKEHQNHISIQSFFIMRRTREYPEVHAGSMADIAFLLLIFFLVTTTIETDKGLDRKLPQEDNQTSIVVNERNVLRISLNKYDQLLVEEKIMSTNQLKDQVIAFLDNGGEVGTDGTYCDYCKGSRDPELSDNPKEAIIVLNSDRNASYGMYVKIQDQLAAAYNALRNREAQRLYGQDFDQMEGRYYAPESNASEKSILKERVETIRSLFPMNISEAELNVQSQNQNL